MFISLAICVGWRKIAFSCSNLHLPATRYPKFCGSFPSNYPITHSLAQLNFNWPWQCMRDARKLLDDEKFSFSSQHDTWCNWLKLCVWLERHCETLSRRDWNLRKGWSWRKKKRENRIFLHARCENSQRQDWKSTAESGFYRKMEFFPSHRNDEKSSHETCAAATRSKVFHMDFPIVFPSDEFRIRAFCLLKFSFIYYFITKNTRFTSPQVNIHKNNRFL